MCGTCLHPEGAHVVPSLDEGLRDIEFYGPDTHGWRRLSRQAHCAHVAEALQSTGTCQSCRPPQGLASTVERPAAHPNPPHHHRSRPPAPHHSAVSPTIHNLYANSAKGMMSMLLERLTH